MNGYFFMYVRKANNRRPKVKLRYNDSNTLISITLLSEGFAPSSEGQPSTFYGSTKCSLFFNCNEMVIIN